MESTTKKNIYIAALVIVLVITNAVTVYYLHTRTQSLNSYAHIVALQETNTKVVDFTKLFIEKVLKANGPIDFDTRLELENAVRDLNDQQVFNQWNTFVNSTDNTQAQTEAKNLLDILIQKINIVG